MLRCFGQILRGLGHIWAVSGAFGKIRGGLDQSGPFQPNVEWLGPSSGKLRHAVWPPARPFKCAVPMRAWTMAWATLLANLVPHAPTASAPLDISVLEGETCTQEQVATLSMASYAACKPRGELRPRQELYASVPSRGDAKAEGERQWEQEGASLPAHPSGCTAGEDPQEAKPGAFAQAGGRAACAALAFRTSRRLK